MEPSDITASFDSRPCCHLQVLPALRQLRGGAEMDEHAVPQAGQEGSQLERHQSFWGQVGSVSCLICQAGGGTCLLPCAAVAHVLRGSWGLPPIRLQGANRLRGLVSLWGQWGEVALPASGACNVHLHFDLREASLCMRHPEGLR